MLGTPFLANIFEALGVLLSGKRLISMLALTCGKWRLRN